MAVLGWTKYRVAQEVVKVRQALGEDVTFTKIQSAVYKAIDDPDNRVTWVNDDIVVALGGEQIIRWKSVNEVSLS